MKKRLLTTGDVARLCQVTVPSIHKWIKKGTLKIYLTPGGQRRIHPTDLIEFMRQGKMHLPEKLLQMCLPYKILVIDDDKLVHVSFSSIISRMGNNYELHHSFDGHHGLIQLGRLSPDLIFLDIHMPKMNGFEILNSLIKDKNASENSNVLAKIVVISAFLESSENKDILDKMGIDCCLDKPLQLENIMNTIKSFRSK